MPDQFSEGRPEPPGHGHANPFASFGTAARINPESALSAQPLNPWFSIWLQPRATIRQVVDTDPQRNVLLFAALAGIGESLDRASMRNAGDRLSLGAILILACVAGPIGGILSLYIGGSLLRWTGSWLGGVATSEQVRAALAYGSIPSIWALLFWVPQLGIFGHEMFTESMPTLEANPALMFVFLGIALCELIVVVWQIVVMLKCVGQVHQFSAWKALGASLLAGLVIVVPILVIVIAVFAIFSVG